LGSIGSGVNVRVSLFVVARKDQTERKAARRKKSSAHRETRRKAGLRKQWSQVVPEKRSEMQ
jgi:hypothetical protein